MDVLALILAVQLDLSDAARQGVVLSATAILYARQYCAAEFELNEKLAQQVIDLAKDLTTAAELERWQADAEARIEDLGKTMLERCEAIYIRGLGPQGRVGRALPDTWLMRRR